MEVAVFTFLKRQMIWPDALTAAWGPARHSENTFLSLSWALRLGTAVFATSSQIWHLFTEASGLPQVALVAENPSANGRDKETWV